MTPPDTEDLIDRSAQLPDGEPVLTKERRKARNAVAIESERGGREYRSLTAPLDFYVARGWITGRQYKAGEKLHALWRGSIIAARYGRMNYGEIGGGFDPESMALMPRDYFRAMDAVKGFHEKRIVRLVCCFGEPTGAGGGLTFLKAGLDDLVRHFRL